MIEIRFDDRKLMQLERELKAFGRTALPRVISRALNRTAKSARTQAARSLSARTGLKIKDVRDRIGLERASYRNWRSAIRISGKRLSLSYMQPRQTKKGLSLKYERKRVLIRSAFPALKGWFIRLPAAGGYKQTIGVKEALEIEGRKKVGRKPIARIKGPILARVFTGAPDEARRIHLEHLKKLEKNVSDQVNLILRRRLPA